MICTQHEILERTVLTYLTGADLAVAARTTGMSPSRFAVAAERYREAGRSTLDPGSAGWAQVDIEFTDYTRTESTFHDELWPILRTRRWWFVRKRPHWRLRYLDPGYPDLPSDLRDAMEAMTASGALQGWRRAVYEPETAAFGGPAGLKAVNDIHAADTAGLLTYLETNDDGGANKPSRPLASLMTAAHLMRAAGLEWTEQGDVWARVGEFRPEAPIAFQASADLARKARTALSTDLTALVRDDTDFTCLSTWAHELHDAGRDLAAITADGALQTGLRTVLARAVLFCWNRAGFTTEQQSVWALAARRAILG